MKLCILTQYYRPEMGAPQARLSELARRFVQAGHQVSVLTALPNYPTGRIYPGYGGAFKKEVLDGVVVLRAWIHPCQRVAMLPRLASYLSFALSSAVFGAAALTPLDYLLTESPPLFLGMTGYLLSRIKRARWIFNVSDLWPESARRLGAVREGPALSAAYRLEAFCYRKAWLVTGQSQEIVDDVRRRFPGVRAWHLSNGVDTTKYSPRRRESSGSADSASPCVAVYAGLHGAAQGLEQVLDAAAQLRDVNLRIDFIGDGPEKKVLVEKSRALGLRNVAFSDALPSDAMPSRLASADIALAPLKCSLPGAVPSKVYEAMGAGLPIVLAADGEAASLVRRTESGVVVPPGDSISLASALRRLATDRDMRLRLGENGRRAAVAHFDRDAIFARFVQFLEDGLNVDPRATRTPCARPPGAFAAPGDRL